MSNTTVEQAMELAIGHYQAGRPAEAAALCRQILAVAPRCAPAVNLLGAIAFEAGQYQQALELIAQAAELEPLDADYLTNLGGVHRAMGNLDQAIAVHQRTIALVPNHAGAHDGLGLALADVRPEEALIAYQRAAALDPLAAGVQSHMGDALQNLGRLDDAQAAYQRALALQPGLADAYNNLGSALRNMGRLDESVASYRRAVQLDPDPVKHSNLLYTLHFHPDCDAATILQEHLRWNERHASPLERHIQPHRNDPTPGRRLRIGYVSGDLRSHAVGRFLLPLLRCHNHDSFEIFCYANLQCPADGLTRQLASHADHWTDIARLSDDRAAQLIRQDAIDILVDLSMHSADNRLLLLAQKPAPVQVTYLAYCSTTGLNTIDYRLTDPYLDPPGQTDRFYTEKSVHLPETYWCYQPAKEAAEVNALPALSTGFITFGCLNSFGKVSPSTLSAWCALLRAVPLSRLLLHAQDGSHRTRLTNLLAEQQIDPQRLEFARRLPLSQYLQLYHQIDIGLDPFPYAGGTTTCDALWMGVPVVTLSGQTAVGRGGASILSNLGLTDLIAHTPEQYVRIAAELADNPTRLTELRATLRDRMQQSPLMDASRFARNVESAYRQMWHTWCASTAPGTHLP